MILIKSFRTYHIEWVFPTRYNLFNEKGRIMSFSWVPIYRELAQKVLEYRDRQTQLLEILREAKRKDLKVMPVSDEGPKARHVIDPFSFFASFNRGQTPENRRKIITCFQSCLGLETKVPSDFDGIPVLIWYFTSSQSATIIEDSICLWDMAFEAFHKTAEEVVPALFDKCLQIKGVLPTNLTMGCFWINPEGFLALHGYNRAYFRKKFDVDLSANSHADYVALLSKVRAVTQDSYTDISLAAYKYRESSHKLSTENGSSIQPSFRYWTYTPGKQATEWEKFFQEGIMAIDEPLGALTVFPSKVEIRRALQKAEESDSSLKNRALSCWEFSKVMCPGDIVFAKKGYSHVLGYGIVRGGYRYDPARTNYAHLREIEWHPGEGDIENQDNRTGIPVFAVKTLTDITPYPEFVQKLSIATGYASNSAPPALIKKYYWLNANPRIWSFENIPLGEEENYTSTNEQGNKRQRYKYFQEVCPGDILIGYITTPKRLITGICEVTKGLHTSEHEEDGVSDSLERISFKKVRDLPVPVTYEELISIPEIANSEPLTSPQGSLFKLTQNEYEHIMKLIDAKNPIQTETIKESLAETSTPYTIDMAMDGLFMDRTHFEGILDALKEKHNIILQGAPGVGKTFVTKRVAYTLIGAKAEEQVAMIQFHQSYSYEDFVQGYRPVATGENLKFALKDGVFHRFCKRAVQHPDQKFVFIIDEINRGNLSKIFGELMMLIEHDKRGKQYEVPLAYAENDKDRFHVPENLYLIGMMNTADRSLAMVDYALRRRFRFIELGPGFATDAFRAYLVENKKAPATLVNKIVERMSAVNVDISADDKNLGRGYRIGHSFFCPQEDITPDDAWYARVINNEIIPLLEEYWFDNPEKVERIKEKLLS